jgi:hypothetical protein
MNLRPRKPLPVDVLFRLDWWHTLGLAFREPFHSAPQVQAEGERIMRWVLKLWPSGR